MWTTDFTGFKPLLESSKMKTLNFRATNTVTRFIANTYTAKTLNISILKYQFKLLIITVCRQGKITMYCILNGPFYIINT